MKEAEAEKQHKIFRRVLGALLVLALLLITGIKCSGQTIDLNDNTYLIKDYNNNSINVNLLDISQPKNKVFTLDVQPSYYNQINVIKVDMTSGTPFDLDVISVQYNNYYGGYLDLGVYKDQSKGLDCTPKTKGINYFKYN